MNQFHPKHTRSFPRLLLLPMTPERRTPIQRRPFLLSALARAESESGTPPASRFRCPALVRRILLVITHPPAQADQLTIGVIGDYGAAYAGGASLSNVQAVANLIKSWNPDFIITTGDNSYPNNEPSNIDTNIGQFFHEYIYPYVGTFGAGASSNRFWPSIGNHEWPFGIAGLAPYSAYFTLPGNERY